MQTFEKLKSIKTFSCFLIDSLLNIQLYDCRDASDVSYGSAVYVITGDVLGRKNSHLVCAQFRNAPKENCSTAHCGIANLVLLMTRVEKPLTITSHKNSFGRFLHWLRKVSKLNKKYVPIREAKVQELTYSMIWRSIRSGLNTVYAISRGTLPIYLVYLLTIHQTCFKEECRLEDKFHHPHLSTFCLQLSFFGFSTNAHLFQCSTWYRQRSQYQTLLIVLIPVDERLDLVDSAINKSIWFCSLNVNAQK